MKIKLFGYVIRIKIHKIHKRPPGSGYRPGAWNELMKPGLRKEFEQAYRTFVEEYMDIPEAPVAKSVNASDLKSDDKKS